MGPGDIVRLSPELWTHEYAGRLAMIVGRANYELDEHYSDRLLLLADPTRPGETIQCWPEELLPFEPQDSNAEPESL